MACSSAGVGGRCSVQGKGGAALVQDGHQARSNRGHVEPADFGLPGTHSDSYLSRSAGCVTLSPREKRSRASIADRPARSIGRRSPGRRTGPPPIRAAATRSEPPASIAPVAMSRDLWHLWDMVIDDADRGDRARGELSAGRRRAGLSRVRRWLSPPRAATCSTSRTRGSGCTTRDARPSPRTRATTCGSWSTRCAPSRPPADAFPVPRAGRHVPRQEPRGGDALLLVRRPLPERVGIVLAAR